jgi:hypothetical protein
LLVVKHRQLARQIGAFGEFAIEKSTDLAINLIFSPGFEFVFGSWVCMADDCGVLRAHLMEIPEAQPFPVQSMDELDHLVEKIQDFSISDSIQIQKTFNKFKSYSDSASAALLRLPYGIME